MRRAPPALLLLALALVAVGCGLEHPALIPDASRGDALTPDVPPPPDDEGSLPDLVIDDVPPPPPDVKVPPDVPVVVDIPAAMDLPATPDVPVVVDVPATPDVVVAPDVPPPMDVPVVMDVPVIDVPPPPVDRPDVVIAPVDVGPPDTGAPPTGTSCESAIPIRVMVGRQTFMGDTERMAAGRYAGSCNAMSPRNTPEAVYRLTLDRPMQVNLVVQPDRSGFDPALYVFRDACGAANELICDADGSGGMSPDARATRVLFPGTYFIVVDGDGSPAMGRTPTGRYNLVVELYETDGYNVTLRTGTTCPAVPSVPFYTGISQIDDGVTSPLTSISPPFRFTLYGRTYGAFAVSTNGYVQLLAGVTTGATRGDPTWQYEDIPDSDAPNAILAPYWRDLIARDINSFIAFWFDGPSSAPVAHVRWRRYVHLVSGNRVLQTDLDFELRMFFHTTSAGDALNDAIEFQYCNVTGDAANLRRVTGLNHSSGIESGDGNTGIQLSYNTANSVHTGDLFRFERR